MEEDERKEAAIANAAALKPNFNSKSLTQEQINKFKDLHRKRLQIKARSNIPKNIKGNASHTRKRHEEELSSEAKNEGTAIVLKDSGNSTARGNSEEFLSLQLDKSAACLGTKKRQKLHWGLDTKERWERKANM